LYENETPVKKEGYLTDLWMEKSVEIIKRKHAKPFFLSIMFNAPHIPLQAPEGKDILSVKSGIALEQKKNLLL
jgi:hypothetical protein